ncbi:MurR/RpiR family transcriptional regulator [Rubrimonas cliftonensis]|uniref:Transcriptional regulator, RpiR family n=1 Tax=Rubrimonas cliftonensis TaxID=89524 RepID=A0A1H4DJX5_9RHOB|nr:MurR/RpiR family transcriptional regulator [Rubrimonas cliftonensis]SEA73133.1 transcriptional regulator, RpiR family [Rubrimonas cliftonensis]
MATRLALRIQNRLEQLSRSERTLAVSLLDRHDDPLVYSASELAKQAGVSKATAARLFRSLGYRDFEEARMEAREERNRSHPSRFVGATPATPKGASAIQTHLQIEIANLTRSFEEMSTERLRRAAHALAHADTVWMLGLGAEAGLAAAGRVMLSRVRPSVQLLGAAPGALAEEVAMVGPGDALLVVALRDAARRTEPIADWARATRLAVVALTDPANAARFTRLGAQTLVCHAVGPPFAASGAAALSMLSLVALSVQEASGTLSQGRLELIGMVEDELGDGA